MSTFLSGSAVDCGPVNVLKSVSGKVDVDRSLQQDRFAYSSNAAGPSRAPFGAHFARQAHIHHDPKLGSPGPFDLTSLRHHLSPPPSTRHSPWADDFTSQPPRATVATRVEDRGWQDEFARTIHSGSHTAAVHSAGPQLNASPPPWERQMQHPQGYPRGHMSHGVMQYTPPPDSSVASREMAHTPQEATTSGTGDALPETLTGSQDLLSRTARMFVETLESENAVLADNPKLGRSRFMSLVRGLGDGGVVIEDGQIPAGDEIAEGIKFVQKQKSGWVKSYTKASGTDVQHQNDIDRRSPYPQGEKVYPALSSWVPALPVHSTTRAHPSTEVYAPIRDDTIAWEQQFQDQEALIHSGENLNDQSSGNSQRRKSVHFSEALGENERSGVPASLEEALASKGNIPGSGWGWTENGLTDDFDEEVFARFSGQLLQSKSDMQGGVGKQENWNGIQRDWDDFQKSEPVIPHYRGMGTGDQVERYLFHPKNPFTAKVDREYRLSDLPISKGILELEAEVQRNPESHEAWYTLGLKQQENEREAQAILALSKVTQIDPDYRPAYLALAVSYTNENESEAACTMLDRWISLGEDQKGHSHTARGGGRTRLIEHLVDIARQRPDEIDADVQVALGVLFNMVGGEDFAKAEDCFLAALAVRPDDWSLHNRLGATLANSGRSSEAIQYYHKALSLHPSFVRALFNLGISYMNLGQYVPAAQSIVDALRLQHADMSEAYEIGQVGGGAKGVTGEALWENLRSACIYMNRQDLVGYVEKRELSSLPLSFVN